MLDLTPPIMDNASQNKLPDTKRRNIFFVGVLSFLGGVSQDVFTPILPIYLTAVLGFDKTFVGIAEGMVAAGVHLSKIISGFLSDRFRRQKPLIFAGYLLSLLSRPLLAILTSGAGIVGLRLADGIGKGLKDPPKDVLIAGSAPRDARGRSFGIVRMLDTLGSVAGPLILFVLLYLWQNDPRMYHYLLIFSGVPLVATLAILATKVRETDAAPVPVVRTAMPAIAPKLPTAFYLFLAISTIFALGNSSDAFLILRSRNLGITLLEIPLVITLFNLVYALAAVPFGALSDRIGRIPTLLLGWSAYAVTYIGFAIAGKAIFVWAFYAFYGIYYAVSEGVAKALIADLIPSEKRGRAFGIYGTTLGLSTLLGSVIAGSLWDRLGPQAPFYLGAALALVATVLLALARKRLKII